MFVMRCLRGKSRRDERGQLMILMVAVVSVFLAVAVLGIDATLWHSQRRTAQKDSDAIALAAGQELLNRSVSAAQIITNGQSVAQTWATRNGIDSSYFTNGSPGVGCGVQASGAANPSCLGSNGCFGSAPFDGKPDTVVADVSKQGTALFSKVWDVLAPNVGAHAKVCIGSPPDAEGVLPIGIPITTASCFDHDGPDNNPATLADNDTPLFGATCDVEIRAPGSPSGETGILRLFNDGSLNCSSQSAGGQNNTNLGAEIANGANTTCAIAPAGSSASNCQIYNADSIGTCVWSDTGNRASTVTDNLQLRLSREGRTTAPYNCDDQFPDTWFNTNNVQPQRNGPAPYNKDHVDQWWEALFPVGGNIHNVAPGPNVTFEKRACTAPRMNTVILIDQFSAQGNPPHLIRGFAAFFITGCRDAGQDNTPGTADDTFNSRCVTGNCRIGNQPCPNPKGEPMLQNSGHLSMEGMFINYIDIGKRGGALTKFGRVQLFLVE